MKRKLIIGTRSSPLALWQAEFVKAELSKKFPHLDISLRHIKTTGDKILDAPLAKIGDKGLFTREIEQVMLDGEIDLAVHSLKDLPTQTPEGLYISTITEREDTRDVLIAKGKYTVKTLPQNAKVATSSLRRKSQLLAVRPDLEMVDMRGNLNTRFKRFEEGDADAMLLAYAGVHRLEFSAHISEIIDSNIMLPAVGQGALGIEIRIGDDETKEIVDILNHSETERCAKCERSLLRHLEGGCQIPIGAHARYENGTFKFSAFVGSLDGKRGLRKDVERTGITTVEQTEAIGIEVAEMLLKEGANEILAEIRPANA
ncbi:MAG: hydroxymethylbilane synthase [Chlorobiales bacterium]|nr:hydroxymethylbilane synthase [Chlorobiales bacterium]